MLVAGISFQYFIIYFSIAQHKPVLVIILCNIINLTSIKSKVVWSMRMRLGQNSRKKQQWNKTHTRTHNDNKQNNLKSLQHLTNNNNNSVVNGGRKKVNGQCSPLAAAADHSTLSLNPKENIHAIGHNKTRIHRSTNNARRPLGNFQEQRSWGFFFALRTRNKYCNSNNKQERPKAQEV